LSMILLGCAGVIVGSKLSSRIPQKRIKQLFALLLIALGLFILGHSIYALWLS